MSIIQTVIIGIIQGFTEFLPVSSSGHMLLAGKIMDVEVSLGYELIMHLATLAAVLIVMRKEVFNIIRHPLKKDARLIIIASVPTAIIIFAFKGFFERSFDGSMLAICFLITAILLLTAGLKAPKGMFITHSRQKRGITANNAANYTGRASKTNGTNNINGNERNGEGGIKKEIGYFDAFIIGTIQGFAALPGISRSGSTISASMLLGNKKSESAHFSFLLSIPVIIGSSLFKLPGNTLDADFIPLLCGFIAAFLSGLLGLKFMLRLFKNMDYFALYLFALSVLLFLNDFWLNWF